VLVLAINPTTFSHRPNLGNDLWKRIDEQPISMMMT